MATTHVDDIAAAGTPKFLKETYSYLTSKFGKVTVQGCRACLSIIVAADTPN